MFTKFTKVQPENSDITIGDYITRLTNLHNELQDSVNEIDDCSVTNKSLSWLPAKFYVIKRILLNAGELTVEVMIIRLVEDKRK